MDLRLFMVADFASLSEGKLNVMGIFNIIRATNFPARHPELQVIVSLNATAAEAGQTRTLSLKLLEVDGDELESIDTQTALCAFRIVQEALNNVISAQEDEGWYCHSVLQRVLLFIRNVEQC